MSADIAVIGRTEWIDLFRVLGCRTFVMGEGSLDEENLNEILKEGFRILLVTEEIYGENRDLIREKTVDTFPAVSVIPDLREARWTGRGPQSKGIAFREMREMVIRAVGQDITGSGESDEE